MIATQDIFAMARKMAQRVAVATGKPSDDGHCKNSRVPSGCVPAGIRYVTRLARMNNYAARLVPCGLLRGNSNAIVQYLC